MYLPVVFRKLGNGDIIALLPTLPGNNLDSSLVAYMSGGKKLEVDASIMKVSTEATHAEREQLLIEVVKAHPMNSVTVRKRITEDLNIERVRTRDTMQIIAAA